MCDTKIEHRELVRDMKAFSREYRKLLRDMKQAGFTIDQLPKDKLRDLLILNQGAFVIEELYRLEKKRHVTPPAKNTKT